MPKWLKIVLAVVAAIAAVFLTLFIVSRVAGFSTIMELVNYLVRYVEFIWTERLFA